MTNEVGPVLETGDLASAVIAAIRRTHREVRVEDHGAYQRVLVPSRCAVSRAAVERAFGKAVRFPGDLESIMPSFKGAFSVDENGARWGVAP